MVQRDHQSRGLRNAAAAFTTTILILSSLISVSNGLKCSPSTHQTRSTVRLNSVALNDAAGLADSIVPFLQNLHLPAISVQVPDALSFLNPLLASGASNLGFFSILDAARFPFLPHQTTEFLLTLPVIVRLSLGLLATDILPAILEIVLLKVVWSKFIAVKTPFKDIDITDLPKEYNVEKIAEFYEKRPRVVLARVTEIIMLAKDYLFGLLSDYQKGILKTNQPLRAIQFTELITTLGPTYIKIGQALSIRPDLASPAYLEELVKLQDQVPPFSSVEALKIIGQKASCYF